MNTLDDYFVIYRKTDSIGDQLLISAVLQKIKNKYKKLIMIMVSHVELFYNNPYVDKLVNIKNPSNNDILFLFKNTQYEYDWQTGITLLINKLRKKGIPFFHDFSFPWMNKKNAHIKKSLVEFYSNGLDIDTADCLPQLYFSNDEHSQFKKKFKLPLIYYVTHSGGIDETKFKQYGSDKIQQIINMTNTHITWVQVGSNNDDELTGTYINLSNKLTIRELCLVIYYCQKVLSIHGVHALIATCFNKINYCIVGDYAFSEQIPYNNIIIIKRPNFDNNPCLLCGGWYCGCVTREKYNWQNDISTTYVAKLILEESII